MSWLDELAALTARNGEVQGDACESCESCKSQALVPPAAGIEGCESAAKTCESAGATPGPSQEFADFRKPENQPQSKERRGLSQDSQDSQGATGHRPFRLTLEQGDRCHAGTWDDDEIGLFVVRHARLLRRGFIDGDACDLAERLTLRDREADDRRLCVECLHLKAWHCGNLAAAGVAPELGRSLATLLQRCAGFTPIDMVGAGRKSGDLALETDRPVKFSRPRNRKLYACAGGHQNSADQAPETDHPGSLQPKPIN